MNRKFCLLDMTLLAVVVLLVAITLAPAVARLQRSPAEAKCQANLRQWARAMALYVADNLDSYPINRAANGGFVSYVQLTPDDQYNPDGTRKRFEHGVNWVESLYPYIQAEASKTGQDWKSIRRCPNAADVDQVPQGSSAATSYMTYAMNGNLERLPAAALRDPGSLMALREMDRGANSLLRPTSATLDSAYSPSCAFLNTADNAAGLFAPTTSPNRHGDGSYIAFADGHVRFFTTEYYPAQCAWDPVTSKWYNFVYPNPSTDTERRLNKSIAVSP